MRLLAETPYLFAELPGIPVDLKHDFQELLVEIALGKTRNLAVSFDHSLSSTSNNSSLVGPTFWVPSRGPTDSLRPCESYLRTPGVGDELKCPLVAHRDSDFNSLACFLPMALDPTLAKNKP